MTPATPSGVSVPVEASHPKERMPSGVPLPTRIRLEAAGGSSDASDLEPVMAAVSEAAAAPATNFLRLICW